MRPFKKRKREGHDDSRQGRQDHIKERSTTTASLAKLSEKTREYPNPGYLGSSSYTTFFDGLEHTGSPTGESSRDVDAQPKVSVNSEKIMQGASLLGQVRSSADISLWGARVESWISDGINLALAHAFTSSCVQTAKYIFAKSDGKEELSRALFSNSCREIALSTSSTLGDFSAMFCMDNARWETLGLFFTAVSRATLEPEPARMSHGSQKQRRNIQRVAMHCSDSCLDMALSLDCLNDLQLMLQYENFILHSLVDGDQSYSSWRKLGDVISSLFALGYHENLGKEATSPVFLQNLRREALFRAYSADKNVSIFLGRPLRVARKYCPVVQRQSPWTSDIFEYQTETKWSAICAMLKEQVLDLREESHATKNITASLIHADAEEQWILLPQRFHLERPLLSYDRHPVELDFMVSARLNYLHVMLLLQLALDCSTLPGAQLLEAAAEMLTITIDAIVTRHRLANSGTSLVWKVAYYGLSAAGVICIALLRCTVGENDTESSPSKMIRNLSVLTAEVQGGALAHEEDPNYALLMGAARAINTLLDRVITKRFAEGSNVCSPARNVEPLWTPDYDNLWNMDHLQDCDPDFWANLANHPFLNMSTEAIEE